MCKKKTGKVIGGRPRLPCNLGQAQPLAYVQSNIALRPANLRAVELTLVFSLADLHSSV